MLTNQLTKIRELKIAAGDDVRTATIYRCEDRGFLLHDSTDVNFDAMTRLAADDDLNVLEVIRDNGFELVESPETTTKYTVTRHIDGQPIGRSVLTPEQFAHYEAMSQQPEGVIRLGALPHDFYELDAEYQGTHEDTTVWLD